MASPEASVSGGFTAIAFCVLASLPLSGCLLNNVWQIPDTVRVKADESRAIVVYGVAVEGAWKYPRLQIALDEYSLVRQNITGNCRRFNRTEADALTQTQEMQYFVFDAPPGHYVNSILSILNTGDLRYSLDPSLHADRNKVVAYTAPAGRISYIGDFIFRKNRTLEFQRNLKAASEALKKSHPELDGELELSEMSRVPRPHPFMCTP